jgi:hypothetical protein
MEPAIPSARLMDVQKALIRTASLVIGIEPKSTQLGGNGLVNGKRAGHVV